MDHVALKKSLRKSMLAARKALSVEDVKSGSEAMAMHWAEAFGNREWKNLHLFLSIAERREPDTSFILEWVRSHRMQANIIIPVVDLATDALVHVQLANDIVLEKNRWGIPEPRAPYKPVFPTVPDMVLVPLLAFDSRGHRLGYGKGHYDRFLSRTRPDCLHIGLCFELGRVEALPSEPHDVPLHAVVTEQGVDWFGKE